VETSEHTVPSSLPNMTPSPPSDVEVTQAGVDRLPRNAFGLFGTFFLCVGAIAPAASMLFNVPVVASQAGAAGSLVFVLSAIAILLLAVPVVYFARRLSSAGGFYTWVRHGLGEGAAFQVGWLLIGAYSLFEAALQATVGGTLDINFSTYFGFHLPGGWVAYALILILIIGILGYFNVKASVWVLVPFTIAELLGLVVLDLAITIHGGIAGHDLLHTFTPAGASLKGVAPGGVLGIGLAMVLAILAFVGFETIAAYGEEARQAKRTIPTTIFSVLLMLAVLYTWTTYSATIGVGWQHAGTVLGNVANAPLQYVSLAQHFVGAWLGIALIVLVTTSNFASTIGYHQTMAHYCYSLGREGILPRWLGRTHPRWQSPYLASLLQSGLTVLMVLLISLIIQHTNKDGSVTYAIGFADSKVFTQTGGIAAFQWLASLFSMCIIVVYLLTNIAVFFFARRRQEFRVFAHLVAPMLSSLILLLPLASYVLPAIPGPIGAYVTALGFAPTPFPSNILPLFVVVWVLLGIAYFLYQRKRHPERLTMLGRIISE
jgi:amino acid transporter